GNYWGSYKYRFVARLRAGIDVASAQSDVRVAARRIRVMNTVWDQGEKYGVDAKVTPLQAQLAGDARTTMLVLLGVVLALLMIACANVANLVLVRSTEREREFAVRTALGCSRTRLARQLITENLILALMGGVSALILATAGVRLLGAALPPQIPRTAAIEVDGRVMLFTTVLALLTGLAVGLIPSIRAARPIRARGLTDLRGASRGVNHARSANVLTIVQLALAVILVTASGLLLRSFDAIRQANTGFSAEQVIVARITLPSGLYKEEARQSAFARNVLSQLEQANGIASVGIVDRPPLRAPVYGRAMRVQGQFEDFRNTLPLIEHSQSVSPNYFGTMGIRIKSGRAFDGTDRDSAPPVAIVSASLAKRFWPNTEAVGHHLGMPYASPWITVVGVVAEVQQDSLNGKTEETVYFPFAQRPTADFTVVAKTSIGVKGFSNQVNQLVKGLDPMAPVSGVSAMNDVVATSFARARFTAFLLSGFALLALLISAVGVYGVVSSTVTQRTREMGVRMALGATPLQVLGHLMSRGVTLAGAGAFAGVVGALFASRWLTSLLYGVTSTDAITFVSAPLILTTVGLLATWLPARRLIQHSASISLRED
ncbi:MAG: FtsX-like permease family protein, partial [Gemmatimonadaceae bacterium]